MATNGTEGGLSEAKVDALKRLSYIEGHLSGVRRMVEDDKYCVDILKQTFAVRRAIQKLESRLLQGHLHSCVIEGVSAYHCSARGAARPQRTRSATWT